MKFIGDFHVHSHYSIATSKDLKPEYTDYWAKIKGIKVIGTGDFTHPGWTKELKEKLEPAEPGLFKLKDEYKLHCPIPETKDNEVRFLLSSEISNIYKKYDKVRKVHNCILAPDFETVEKIQQKLQSLKFNITSDGRPILGLDSRDLLEIVLDANEDIFFIPAHIWTPWFSALGDKSGFDTIEECYADLSSHIFAVETGLSTDPPMNWTCSFLDKYTLVSNSDAHSPEKLGRNANIFNTKLSYYDIIDAMKTGNPEHFLGTIDFFPQEGKYHFDGHRKCGIKWNPLQTLRHNGICPVCGKKVTVGVMNRIAQLTDRDNILDRKNRLPFYSLIPLKEILSEIQGVGKNSKKITREYNSLIQKAGSEFNLLYNFTIEDVKKIGGEILAEAIRRMRNREVYIEEGFDGVFGKIKVFNNKPKEIESQESLFMEPDAEKYSKKKSIELINFDLKKYKELKKSLSENTPNIKIKGTYSLSNSSDDVLYELNKEQRQAADHFLGPALVTAGPGTGKTRVLTYRIAYLILRKNIYPQNILALTFTNKAAKEVKERLDELLYNKADISELKVTTFHAFGLSMITDQIDKTGRSNNFIIIDEDEKKQILIKAGYKKTDIKKISKSITDVKQSLLSINEIKDENLKSVIKYYDTFLEKQNIFDLDDLIYYPAMILKKYPETLFYYKNKYKWILIDEYQDVNFAQYQIIKMMMPDKDSNLCVIGDPNQAIYGFRGANIKYIQSFIDDYPNASIYKLKKSYRCSDLILKASNEVVRNNISEDILLKGLQKGVKIKIIKNTTDKSEAEFVARTIEKMIGGLRFFSMDSNITQGNEDENIKSLSDFVVLFRIGKQVKVLEKAFNDHSIPYQIIGDIPFFKKEPVNSIIDFLKFSLNPDNIFIKNKLIDKKIINESQSEGISHLIENKSVKDAIESIIDNYFSKEKLKYKSLIKNLFDYAHNFGDNIKEFLKFTALGTSVDTYKPNTESVTLMSIHSAKGLEFKCVFIVGCEDGLLPYSIFENQKSDPEEERRLLYVGMTRAKEFLFLTHAEKRYIMGKEYHLQRSPYLDNIEKELTELPKSKYKKPIKVKDNQLNLF